MQYYNPNQFTGYNPNQFTGYNPNQFTGYQTNVQPLNQDNIIWVQGEEGAKARNVAPGQRVLMMDSERQTFYIKSADAYGIPQPLEIYDFQKREPEAKPEADMPGYVKKSELTALLDEWLNGKEKNESTI